MTERLWELPCRWWEAERRRVRFEQIAQDLPELRAKFADSYKQAALMLGEFYGLGYELRELANHLCHKIPNGTRYRALI